VPTNSNNFLLLLNYKVNFTQPERYHTNMLCPIIKDYPQSFYQAVKRRL